MKRKKKILRPLATVPAPAQPVADAYCEKCGGMVNGNGCGHPRR
jgi:hypothetical protein